MKLTPEQAAEIVDDCLEVLRRQIDYFNAPESVQEQLTSMMLAAFSPQREPTRELLAWMMRSPSHAHKLTLFEDTASDGIVVTLFPDNIRRVVMVLRKQKFDLSRDIERIEKMLFAMDSAADGGAPGGTA